MTDEQENRTVRSDEELAPEDDAKMSILAAVEATHGNPPGSGSVLDEEELDSGRAPLDINTAAEHQLAKIPGIGPALARAIVDYRENVRPFREPSDITAVPGVSRETYDHVADRILVEPVEEDKPLVIGYDELPPDQDEPGDVDIELLDPDAGRGQTPEGPPLARRGKGATPGASGTEPGLEGESGDTAEPPPASS